MTLAELVALVKPLADSRVVDAIVSSIVGALTALFVYWLKSREPLAAMVAWNWCVDPFGKEEEQPFLVVQNRSDVDAFIKDARLLRGNFIRREAIAYPFSYYELTEGNFPLTICALGISRFPLSVEYANQTISKARWFNKALGYLFKRPFLWIEVNTIGGRTLVVPANQIVDLDKRSMWVDLRWFPTPKSKLN